MQRHDSVQLFLTDRLVSLQAEQQRIGDRREAMLDKLRRFERMHSHLSLNPAHAERCNELMRRMLLTHAELHALDQKMVRLRHAARAIHHEAGAASL
ncbi:hypothetical protein HC891_11075 [Candidatus Gracilibacteria bacterium]|nr:hypothetical protein [Candidatus Gracilibacteria bacterium]